MVNLEENVVNIFAKDAYFQFSVGGASVHVSHLICINAAGWIWKLNFEFETSSANKLLFLSNIYGHSRNR